MSSKVESAPDLKPPRPAQLDGPRPLDERVGSTRAHIGRRLERVEAADEEGRDTEVVVIEQGVRDLFARGHRVLNIDVVGSPAWANGGSSNSATPPVNTRRRLTTGSKPGPVRSIATSCHCRNGGL